MTLNLTWMLPYVLLATTAVALSLCVYFWLQRRLPGALWMSACLLSCGIWILSDALAYLIKHPATQDGLRRGASLAILAATFAFFRFACSYGRRASWWRSLRVPLVGAVTINLLLIATNSIHHLIWHESDWVDLGFARIPVMVLGPAFYWLQLPLTYGLILGGVAALYAHTSGSQTFYIRRVVVLSLGLATPLVVNSLVVAQLTRGVDLTPVALLISMITVAWVTLHDQLLDVMPSVRSLVFQKYRDAVVVVDGEYRVLDMNPAAERLLGCDASQGVAVAKVLPFWEQVRQAVETADGGSTEVAHASLVVDLRSTLIHDDRRRAIGRLIVLHDVTERVRLIRELDAYARTVAHDLKNPLAAAAGYLELLEMTEPPMAPESTRRLDQAREICDQMTGIVDGLLRRRAPAPVGQ